MGAGDFFISYEKTLSGIAAIATAAGMLFGLAGIGFAGYQLRETRAALEAGTILQLQLAGREVLEKADPEILDYIYNNQASKDYPEDVKAKSSLFIVRLLQYYSMVNNQRTNKVISDRYWKPFENEIRRALCTRPIAAFWVEKVMKSDAYSNEFKSLGNRLISEGCP